MFKTSSYSLMNSPINYIDIRWWQYWHCNCTYYFMFSIINVPANRKSTLMMMIIISNNDNNNNSNPLLKSMIEVRLYVGHWCLLSHNYKYGIINRWGTPPTPAKPVFFVRVWYFHHSVCCWSWWSYIFCDSSNIYLVTIGYFFTV